MYRLSKNADYILLIVYVDDLLYIGSTDDIIIWFEGELQKDLTLTVSSTVTQYLGLNIREEENAIYLSAEKYADTIAKRFSLTPTAIATPYRHMTGSGKGNSASLKPAGIRNYQKKLGCLLFAAVTCRPDLSYSASQLATYLKRPEAEHLAELDRALHYFVSTPTIGLTYRKNATAPPKLTGYVDADHAGDSDNRRSRTGYIYRLEPIGPISWQSSKQELIALSSAEAEYIALCSATKEGLYLRELLEEAKLAELPSFTVFCDNQSAIRIANKNGFANRTKHIALRYFFVKDEIEKGKLELSYCPTSEMAADYLTKKLGKQNEQMLGAHVHNRAVRLALLALHVPLLRMLPRQLNRPHLLLRISEPLPRHRLRSQRRCRPAYPPQRLGPRSRHVSDSLPQPLLVPFIQLHPLLPFLPPFPPLPLPFPAPGNPPSPPPLLPIHLHPISSHRSAPLPPLGHRATTTNVPALPSFAGLDAREGSGGVEADGGELLPHALCCELPACVRVARQDWPAV
ncbi:unnamed protein product, partial [Closterium sp. NIES-54]